MLLSRVTHMSLVLLRLLNAEFPGRYNSFQSVYLLLNALIILDSRKIQLQEMYKFQAAGDV